MRETDLGRYQMLWDCPYCETPKLLGLTHRHCPSCGAAQDPSRRYFPSDEDKVAVEDHKYTGADKVCPSCSAPSGSLATHCGACGSPLDEAKSAATRQSQTAGADGFQADSATNAEREHKAARAPAPVAPPPKKKSRLGCLILVGLALVGLAAVCMLSMFWKKDATLEVTGHTWQRTISIERYEEATDSAWCDAVPSGADITDRKQEKRSTNKVADGEDCKTKRTDNGDGTFSEKEECHPRYKEEPVYDDKCYYNVLKWVKLRDATESARALTPAPHWASIQVDSCRVEGCTREGSRTETYTLTLRDADGEDYRCDLPEKTWRGFAEGSKWTGQISVIGSSVDCSALQAAR